MEDYFRLLTPPGPEGVPGGEGAPGGDGAPEEASDGPDDWRVRLSPRVRELLGSARGPVPEEAADDTAQTMRCGGIVTRNGTPFRLRRSQDISWPNAWQRWPETQAEELSGLSRLDQTQSRSSLTHLPRPILLNAARVRTGHPGTAYHQIYRLVQFHEHLNLLQPRQPLLDFLIQIDGEGSPPALTAPRGS